MSAAVAVTMALLAPGPALSSVPPSPASYIVVLAPGAGDAGAVAAEHAARLGFAPRHVYRAALSGYAADLAPDALRALRADPRVAALEADRPMARTAAVPPGVDRIEADLSATAGIDDADRPRIDADVAVLDTGIDKDHPDLNVAGGANCAKKVKGYDDKLGHGTHIAGIVGALDDGRGVVGVAPGVRLWAVRVLDGEGRGTTKELLCGLDWVTSTRLDRDPGNDIEVANLSLGGENLVDGERVPGDDGQCGHIDHDVLHQAVCRAVAAGLTIVAAAGNDFSDARYFTPAAYREVITVSALADSDGRPGSLGGSPACRPDGDDTLADFSNYGTDVDLIAPGVCILSTVPPDGKVDSTAPGYGLLTGTSFAAPHVSGAAALWLSSHPGASPAQVRDALVAAGSADWDAGEDPDGVKEPLVDAAPF